MSLTSEHYDQIRREFVYVDGYGYETRRPLIDAIRDTANGSVVPMSDPASTRFAGMSDEQLDRTIAHTQWLKKQLGGNLQGQRGTNRHRRGWQTAKTRYQRRQMKMRARFWRRVTAPARIWGEAFLDGARAARRMWA